jgi:hypothetical protein
MASMKVRPYPGWDGLAVTRRDDFLDTVVPAWTAKRRIDGCAERLGGVLSSGPGSLRMEIVY